MKKYLHIYNAPQRGLTLVELMVAMALGLIIALAAIAALILSQQGFRTVDASTQLKDNGRFAAEIIRRVILQAGYQSTQFAIDRNHKFQLTNSNDIEPHIKGFNNSAYNQNLVTGVSSTVSSSGTGSNGSDLLIIRYQVGTATPNEVVDQTMINCSGGTDDIAPIGIDDRLVSAFYIGNSSGEPALMCAYKSGSTWHTQPLISGVESFQVLYGTHNVTANTAPSALSSNTPTPPPDQYLRADQLTISGNETATRENWSRVRSIKIGMVLRGAVGSAFDSEQVLQLPFGTTSLCTSADNKCSYNAAADRRLRQSVTFTVHLRNPQKM